MKQILILLSAFALFSTTTQAETITANYKVEFGIFGEIGIANATLTKDETSYEIDVELEATGLAKKLSSNRKEHHISKGHMENGVMVSDMYQVIKSHGSKTKTKIYTIDHTAKTVNKHYKRWNNGELTSDSNESMDYYSKNDLLTLYFNLDKLVEDKQKSASYTFTAVGAEKQNGSVDVVIPKSDEEQEFKDSVGDKGEKGWYARAIINQDIFSSDKGELLLRIGEDGVTQKAVLKDLILFGDIRAERL
jgi:hypothetical protein